MTIERLDIASIGNILSHGIYMDCLSKEYLQEAKEDAKAWTEYFKKLDVEFAEDNILQELDESIQEDITSNRVGDLLDQKIIAYATLTLRANDFQKLAYQMIGLLSGVFFCKEEDIKKQIVDLLEQAYKKYVQCIDITQEQIQEQTSNPSISTQYFDICEVRDDHIQHLIDKGILDLKLIERILQYKPINTLKYKKIFKKEYIKYFLVGLPNSMELNMQMYKLFCDMFPEMHERNIFNIAGLCTSIEEIS